MRHLARLAGLAIVVPALLAACSATGTTAAGTDTHTDPPATSTAPSATAGAAPTTDSGTRLAAALVTKVPAGFTLDKSGTVDTGTDVQTEVDGAMKGHSHCADLDGTSWIGVSGMSGIAFAQSDYSDKHDQEIAQEVDAFSTPSGAARAMSQLKKFMGGCTSFADAGSKSITWHLAVSPDPSVGAGAIKGTLTSANIYGGVVEVAVQRGDDVITTLVSARKLSDAKSASNLATMIRSSLSD
ncbi:MAG TPA: hypothetical protein VGF84_03370 [Micromonosporaceae bacterium]|jgi:hypothetical protein